MKKILVFLSMLFAFIGCNKENAPETEFVEKEKYNYFSVKIEGTDDIELQHIYVTYNDKEDSFPTKEEFKNIGSNTWNSKEYKVLEKYGFSFGIISAKGKDKNSRIKMQLLSKGKVIKEKILEPVKLNVENPEFEFLAGYMSDSKGLDED